MARGVGREGLGVEITVECAVGATNDPIMAGTFILAATSPARGEHSSTECAGVSISGSTWSCHGKRAEAPAGAQPQSGREFLECRT
jgi:hypothetical protein